MMKFASWILFASLAMPLAAAAQAPVPAGESDQTLRAMHVKWNARALVFRFPAWTSPRIEYRLLDLDVRSVSASFGALLSNSTSRQRVMSVDVRVGDYHLDGSNFVRRRTVFRGTSRFHRFTSGIDHDYNSLRQDLWLATDQAYKQAATQMALKQAFCCAECEAAGD